MKKYKTINEKEARELLDLPKTGRLKSTAIESKYNKLARYWTAQMNSALKKDERERAADVLALLQQAKVICLNSGGNQNVANNSTSTAMPTMNTSGGGSNAARTQRWHGNYCTIGMRNTAAKFADVFVHFWLSLKSIFEFVISIPSAVVEVKDFVSDVLDDLHSVGIPKAAVVLVLILGFMFLLQGCGPIFQKVVGLFK